MTMQHEDHGRGERLSLEGLTINPATDRLFTAAVRRAAAASRSLVELEARLRRHFPRARVRAQVSDGRGVATWFIYRDGTWTTELPTHLRARLAAMQVRTMSALVRVEPGRVEPVRADARAIPTRR